MMQSDDTRPVSTSMSDGDLSSEHLSPDRVAAYVDGALSLAARQIVELHLANCEECRHEVAEVVSLVRRFGRRRRFYITLPVAAAAAILLLAVLPSHVDERLAPTLRTGVDEGVLVVTVVAPASGDSLPLDAIGFAWRSFAPDAQYNMLLTTAEGSEVWRISTRDTSAAPPRDLGLMPGQTYFWYVDALLPDGSTATTGIRRFTVGP